MRLLRITKLTEFLPPTFDTLEGSGMLETGMNVAFPRVKRGKAFWMARMEIQSTFAVVGSSLEEIGAKWRLRKGPNRNFGHVWCIEMRASIVRSSIVMGIVYRPTWHSYCFEPSVGSSQVL